MELRSGISSRLRFDAPFTDSTLSIINVSVQATIPKYGTAVAIHFVAPVTNSTMEISHGSAVSAGRSSNGGTAYAILFNNVFTDSTLVVSHGSALTASSGGAWPSASRMPSPTPLW